MGARLAHPDANLGLHCTYSAGSQSSEVSQTPSMTAANTTLATSTKGGQKHHTRCGCHAATRTHLHPNFQDNQHYVQPVMHLLLPSFAMNCQEILCIQSDAHVAAIVLEIFLPRMFGVSSQRVAHVNAIVRHELPIEPMYTERCTCCCHRLP